MAAGKRFRFSSRAYCRATRSLRRSCGRCWVPCSVARRSKPRRKRCAYRFRWRPRMAWFDVWNSDLMQCESGSAASSHHPPRGKLILCSKRSVTCKRSSGRTRAPSRRTSGIFSRRFWANHGLKPKADAAFAPSLLSPLPCFRPSPAKPVGFLPCLNNAAAFVSRWRGPRAFQAPPEVRARLLRQKGLHSFYYV